MGNKVVCSLALLASLPVFGGCASTTTKPAGAQPSMLDKVSTSMKKGTASVAGIFTKKPKPGEPPANELNGNAGPNVYVAMAEVNVRTESFDEAEKNYNKALEMEPNNLQALIGYAHLEDRRHNFEASLKLYKRAMKKHSRDASVHNDLGLCYQQRGMLPEAAKSMQRAVELSPDRKLYRNNLATILVDQGKTKEALVQLNVAHGEAVGNYNLAFLLMKKQDHAAALAHFRTALEKDATLTAAQEWIAQLSTPAGQNEPKSNEVAIIETAQRTVSTTEPQAASARFTIESAPAETSTATQGVLRAGGTGDAPQNPVTSVQPVVEKPAEPQAPATRWPNRLRDSENPMREQAPQENRLPSVDAAKG